MQRKKKSQKIRSGVTTSNGWENYDILAQNTALLMSESGAVLNVVNYLKKSVFFTCQIKVHK